MQRSLEWLYQQLGKAYSDNCILREELAAAQAQLAQAQRSIPVPVAPEAQSEPDQH